MPESGNFKPAKSGNFSPALTIIYVFGILLIIIGILETILSGTWNNLYFLYGIQIYSKEIEITDVNKTSQKIDDFFNNLDSVSGFTKYKGKKLDDNTFVFRKKLITVSFFRNDFENIHGTVIINPENRTLKIKGYAGYTVLAFMLYFVLFFMSQNEYIITSVISGLILILIIGSISYAFDHRKYKKLYAEISKLINM